MPHSVLISGGAGFIGSALSHRLVNAGYDVAVMDILHPQVHAKGRAIMLPSSVRLFTGDVTHAPDWDAVLRLFTPSQIVHLAAETGTAQSLSGRPATARSTWSAPPSCWMRSVGQGWYPTSSSLASSRAVYGEGAWQYGDQVFYPRPRSHAQLAAGAWDPEGPAGERAVPLPSRADRTEPRPTNIYGATKLAQEHLLAAWGAAHNAPLSVLRLQNVYGPGQSLTNPYTGWFRSSPAQPASSVRRRYSRTAGSCAIWFTSTMSSMRCSRPSAARRRVAVPRHRIGNRHHHPRTRHEDRSHIRRTEAEHRAEIPATVTFGRRVATSSPRRGNSIGVRGGRSTTVWQR